MSVPEAAPREPLHARVAGWLEHAFNPIMVKELRASLRGSKFFIAHLTILSLFTGGLLITFAVAMSQSTVYNYDDFAYGRISIGDPSRVGMTVYLITQILHLAVVFLVVPGLAASSVTSEREALTHELLLSTTLTAREIVWGKFTAAMTQTFTIFVSMIPMVALCFLFGGVTIYQIVANYLFLFALSALMIIFALSISASSRSTQRAVGSVYAMALLAASVACGVAVAAIEGRLSLPNAMGVAYGFIQAGQEGVASGPLSLFRRIMYVYVMPGFAWAALASLFFINAVNRLKPIYANRSTALRLYYLSVMAAACGLALVTIFAEQPVDSSTPLDRAFAVATYAIALTSPILMCALFACEDPVLPPALAAQVAGLRGPRRFLRLFWPGSGSGAMFCVLSTALLLLSSYAALRGYATGFAQGAWAGAPSAFPLILPLLVLFLWSFFTAVFARFLAVLLPGRPVLSRAILVITCLFLAIFPIVHSAIARSIDRNPRDPNFLHGPATLGLSPVAAILSSLDLSPTRRSFPLFAGGLPVAALFTIFTIVVGAILLILAEKGAAKARAQALLGGGNAP